MLTEYGRIATHSEDFNKELENIKNNQAELKNTITEMKTALEGIYIILNDTENGLVAWKTE